MLTQEILILRKIDGTSDSLAPKRALVELQHTKSFYQEWKDESMVRFGGKFITIWSLTDHESLNLLRKFLKYV